MYSVQTSTLDYFFNSFLSYVLKNHRPIQTFSAGAYRDTINVDCNISLCGHDSISISPSQTSRGNYNFWPRASRLEQGPSVAAPPTLLAQQFHKRYLQTGRVNNPNLHTGIHSVLLIIPHSYRNSRDIMCLSSSPLSQLDHHLSVVGITKTTLYCRRRRNFL